VVFQTFVDRLISEQHRNHGHPRRREQAECQVAAAGHFDGKRDSSERRVINPYRLQFWRVRAEKVLDIAR
jgi:hypothetical protein